MGNKYEMRREKHERSIRVVGKDFVCGATIAKNDAGEWYVVDIAPYLKKIVQGIPIREWGDKFRSIGATYEWLTEELDEQAGMA